jgi:hypothetical protein
MELEDASKMVKEAEGAKKMSLEKIRYAEELESRADAAVFQVLMIVGKANRVLIDSEVAAAEKALRFAIRKIDRLGEEPMAVSDDGEISSAFRVPFAFRSRVQGGVNE